MTMLSYLALPLALLQPIVHGAAVASNTPPFFPTYWEFQGYPRISSDIAWGTPPQHILAGAIVNYGSAYHYTEGKCNVTAHPSYNYTSSKTATKLVKKETGYSYGGNGKLVYAYSQINDTISWTSGNVPALKNRRVALSNFTIITQAADKCYNSRFTYDHSILGISSPIDKSFPPSGPSFRGDLLADGLIQSGSMSMWFDKQPALYNGTFHGSVMFGGLPTTKYSGPLVHVNNSVPEGTYVGYYIPAAISITANNLLHPKKHSTINIGKATKQCLLDSGTGQDILPVDAESFARATGLILMDNGVHIFNGSCDSMPNTAAVNFTFPALAKGKNITISMPLRNYVRDNQGLYNSSVCAMSLDAYKSNDCLLGAPFMTSLFLAVNDDKNEIGIAQGGVSSGAQAGSAGLGKVTTIAKGKSLPFTY